MPAPRKYPDELRQRAVRLVRDRVAEERGLSVSKACRLVGEDLGIVPDTLRGWVKTALVDDRQLPGTTTEDATRIRDLETEVRQLRRANRILREASAYFAQAELDRH